METYCGSRSIAVLILNLGTGSASHPGHFTPGLRAHQYPFSRRQRGLQSWLGRFVEDKSLLPCQESNPVLSSLSCVEGAMYHICDLSLFSLQQLGVIPSLKCCDVLSSLPVSLAFSLCCNEKFIVGL